jgi:hypothetical protein
VRIALSSFVFIAALLGGLGWILVHIRQPRTEIAAASEMKKERHWTPVFFVLLGAIEPIMNAPIRNPRFEMAVG